MTIALPRDTHWIVLVDDRDPVWVEDGSYYGWGALDKTGEWITRLTADTVQRARETKDFVRDHLDEFVLTYRRIPEDDTMTATLPPDTYWVVLVDDTTPEWLDYDDYRGWVAINEDGEWIDNLDTDIVAAAVAAGTLIPDNDPGDYAQSYRISPAVTP